MNVNIPGSDPSTAIDSSMELEDVFRYFLGKFDTLPEGPKSVVEARIASRDLQSLKDWLCNRWELGMWCQDTRHHNNISSSQQEMCGVLLLIFASEVCRDNCSEDAMWS